MVRITEDAQIGLDQLAHGFRLRAVLAARLLDYRAPLQPVRAPRRSASSAPPCAVKISQTVLNRSELGHYWDYIAAPKAASISWKAR